MRHQRILFILTSADRIGPKALPTGYYFPEVAHAYLVFAADGHRVAFASVRGGEPPMEGFDESDSSSVIFRKSESFVRLNQSARLADIDPTEFDAIYFPGGHGPMVDLVDEPVVKRAILAVHQAGGVIGAVCHGPAALLGVAMPDGTPFLKGRRVTAFSSDEEREMYDMENVPFVLDEAMKREGARYTYAPVLEEHVVTDGRLVTGQNPASSIGVARAMLVASRASLRGEPTEAA